MQFKFFQIQIVFIIALSWNIHFLYVRKNSIEKIQKYIEVFHIGNFHWSSLLYFSSLPRRCGGLQFSKCSRISLHSWVPVHKEAGQFLNRFLQTQPVRKAAFIGQWGRPGGGEGRGRSFILFFSSSTFAAQVVKASLAAVCRSLLSEKTTARYSLSLASSSLLSKQMPVSLSAHEMKHCSGRGQL